MIKTGYWSLTNLPEKVTIITFYFLPGPGIKKSFWPGPLYMELIAFQFNYSTHFFFANFQKIRKPAMKKSIIVTFVSAILFTSLSSFAQSYSLFNGRDLNGWHIDVPERDTNATDINPFIIRNGLLVSLGTPQGHIITDSVYQNFRLQVEYRFAGEPGNCGVFPYPER